MTCIRQNDTKDYTISKLTTFSAPILLQPVRNQLVIESGSGSSDSPDLPFSMGSAMLGIGVTALTITLIRKRKFT